MKKPINDQPILDLISNGDRRMLKRVYQTYRPSIIHYVRSHNGNLQDAQDLYQEVMVAFYVNIESGRLTQLQGKLSTYLYKLAQNLWHTHLRKHEPLRGALDLTDYPLELSASRADEDAYLQDLLGLLNSRCRHLLKLYYFDSLPMKTVAEQIGLDNVESVRKRKWDCLDKLRQLALQYNASLIDHK